MIKPPYPPADTPPWGSAMLRDLSVWVGNLIFLPQSRKVYTITTLPPAADFDGATVPLSNGAGNKPTATSVGGTWRYPDGTAV